MEPRIVKIYDFLIDLVAIRAPQRWQVGKKFAGDPNLRAPGVKRKNVSVSFGEPGRSFSGQRLSDIIFSNQSLQIF